MSKCIDLQGKSALIMSAARSVSQRATQSS
jgi:hypothetical protein